jgi:hypothetical protein
VSFLEERKIAPTDWISADNVHTILTGDDASRKAIGVSQKQIQSVLSCRRTPSKTKMKTPAPRMEVDEGSRDRDEEIKIRVINQQLQKLDRFASI